VGHEHICNFHRLNKIRKKHMFENIFLHILFLILQFVFRYALFSFRANRRTCFNIKVSFFAEDRLDLFALPAVGEKIGESPDTFTLQHSNASSNFFFA